MLPPKIVRVGPADYQVKLRGKGGLEDLGSTENWHARILVQKHQAPATMRDTVLHEVLHAIVFMSGLGHNLAHDDEERIVRIMSPWILQLIRENPFLIEFLLGDVE